MSIPVLGIPILNNPDKLYDLLRSIDFPVGRILVVDNGSVVNPVHAQAQTHFGPVDVITPGTNLGVPGSWNLIVKCNPFAPHWLIVNNDITFPQGALGRFANAARRDALVLSAGAPPWCAFMLGDQVVTRVGLFDEAIYPAYFEDNDYERRCTFHGVPVVGSGIHVNHDNSSTIREARYQAANNRTFGANHAYYSAKVSHGDMTAGEWSLSTRRANSWD